MNILSLARLSAIMTKKWITRLSQSSDAAASTCEVWKKTTATPTSTKAMVSTFDTESDGERSP